MADINDLVLRIENIKKDIIPVIKFLAEFEKQFLNLVLERLIILPDFSLEENEKKQEGSENFHEFMKNLNIFFYANIQIFDKCIQSYLSAGKNFSTTNISEMMLHVCDYSYRIPETYENYKILQNFVSTCYTVSPQILPVQEKIGNIANSNYEFIYSIINSMYKSHEIYDKSKIETEGEWGKIYEQKFFIPQILPVYEKIGEVSNITYKLISNITGVSKTSEIYARHEQEDGKYKYGGHREYYYNFAFTPQILQLYEKIGNIANSNYEFIYSIINSMYKSHEIYDKSKIETEGEWGKIYEQKFFIPQILPVYEKIGEVSNITYKLISNSISSISDTGETYGIYEKETLSSSVLNIKKIFENLESKKNYETITSYSNLSSVLEIHKIFENTAKENIIEISNFADIFKTNEMFTLIQSAKPELHEGINYAANIPEVYEKFKIFSEENKYVKYVNDVVERTTSIINNNYISSNLYGSNRGSEFINSLISYENTKIDNVFSLISAAVPSTFPATTTNKTINNTFNISIIAKSISEEQELMELGKKIVRIINEEIRRAGI